MDNKLHIHQQGNLYRIVHPVGFLILEVMMPDDGQYYKDSKTLAEIGSALAKRYNLK